uniref:Kinectin n=1 Tax=Lygus hesperus TaxID=30085 RepID=A0A0A9Z1N5_LYGHE
MTLTRNQKRKQLVDTLEEINTLTIGAEDLNAIKDEFIDFINEFTQNVEDDKLQPLCVSVLKMFKYVNSKLEDINYLQNEVSTLQAAFDKSRNKLNNSLREHLAFEDGWIDEKLKLIATIKQLQSHSQAVEQRSQRLLVNDMVDSESQTDASVENQNGAERNDYEILDSSFDVGEETDETHIIKSLPDLDSSSVSLKIELIESEIVRLVMALDEVKLRSTYYDGGTNMIKPTISVIEKKSEAKVFMFGDEQFVGLRNIVEQWSSSDFKFEASVKANAPIEDILSDIYKTEIKKDDYIVVSAGSLEMEFNNASYIKRSLLRLLATFYQTNVVIYELPFHYELPPWSILNMEIFRINKFIRELKSKFPKLSIISCNGSSSTNFGEKRYSSNLRRKKKNIMARNLVDVIEENWREQINLGREVFCCGTEDGELFLEGKI